MIARAVTVELPHGLFDADGVCHRDAVLRAMTGHEELMLADLGPGEAGEPNPGAVSALLVSVIERLGDYDRIDGELVGALTRGDRAVLVLHLRAGLYGDRMSLVVRCPNPACAALCDVDLRISELLPRPAAPRPHVACDTPSGPAVIHEPTGADDDAVAAVADRGGSREERVALLWSRLVELDGRRLAPDEWPRLPAATRHAIAVALAEGSRAPELTFLARCPTCAAHLELGIDPYAMLARELRLGGDRLFAEVHALAFHYHWSEAEILALPRPRRWRYLELLGRELEGRPL
ncbi:MAG TPA: hypothetical protein VLM79_04235 [Kofleriaceae bacterium]|nr:hypothetical protein [Kofleriaceae bacterium]